MSTHDATDHSGGHATATAPATTNADLPLREINSKLHAGTVKLDLMGDGVEQRVVEVTADGRYGVESRAGGGIDYHLLTPARFREIMREIDW